MTRGLYYSLYFAMKLIANYRNVFQSYKNADFVGVLSFYSNSSHRRLITAILIAFSLLSVAVFAIFSVMILTGIKIVLKLNSRQHNKNYSSINGIFINSCSFFCNTALSGNCNLYSATIIGDNVLLIAYSTTSSSLEAQRIIPTLGFSFSFFF